MWWKRHFLESLKELFLNLTLPFFAMKIWLKAKWASRKMNKKWNKYISIKVQPCLITKSSDQNFDCIQQAIEDIRTNNSKILEKGNKSGGFYGVDFEKERKNKFKMKRNTRRMVCCYLK